MCNCSAGQKTIAKLDGDCLFLDIARHILLLVHGSDLTGIDQNYSTQTQEQGIQKWEIKN
ncbi:MAG: hypothetical protein WBA89_16460 [Microcoleus sp.]